MFQILDINKGLGNFWLVWGKKGMVLLIILDILVTIYILVKEKSGK